MSKLDQIKVDINNDVVDQLLHLLYEIEVDGKVMSDLFNLLDDDDEEIDKVLEEENDKIKETLKLLKK